MSIPPPYPEPAQQPYGYGAPAPYAGPFGAPVRAGDRRPVTAIVSLVLGAVVFAGTIVAKIAAAAVTDTPEGVLSALGVASFFSLLLIVPAIVLGHLALARTGRGARVGRGLAAGALVLAYVDLALFLARMLTAAIATAGLGDPSAFFYEMFYWV